MKINIEMNQSKKKKAFSLEKKIFIYLGLICKLYNNMNFKIDISP